MKTHYAIFLIYFFSLFELSCSKSAKNKDLNPTPNPTTVDTTEVNFLKNNSFRAMKYGIFVHYVKDLTVFSNGNICSDMAVLTNNFNADTFASDIEEMGVEYVIFTAWHADMNLLYPSPKMDSWISGHTTKRDLIGAMIDAVRSKGIKVLLYTHPYLGYHFTDIEKTLTGWGVGVNAQGDDAPNWATFDHTKWNNFTR